VLEDGFWVLGDGKKLEPKKDCHSRESGNLEGELDCPVKPDNDVSKEIAATLH
jgi:hypothetical protein